MALFCTTVVTERGARDGSEGGRTFVYKVHHVKDRVTRAASSEKAHALARAGCRCVGTSSLQPRTEGIGQRCYLFGEPRLRESARKVGVSPTTRAQRLLVRDAVRTMTRRLAVASLFAKRWSAYYVVIRHCASGPNNNTTLFSINGRDAGQIYQNPSLIS